MNHNDPEPSVGDMGMVPYLHFTGGDTLIFKALAPKSPGAITGSSIVLLCVALFERWVVAMRHVLEARLREKAPEISPPLDAVKADLSPSSGVEAKHLEVVEVVNVSEATSQEGQPTDFPIPAKPRTPHERRTFAPFILVHDASRGAMYALEMLLGYALMLSVMTFQVAYIIAILAGLGIGEMIFGRVKVVQRHNRR